MKDSASISDSIAKSNTTGMRHLNILRIIQNSKLPSHQTITENLRKSLLVLKKGLAQEKEETKRMLQIYHKFTIGDATEAELQEANQQFIDVLRSLGLSIVVILPFSPVTLPALVKLGNKLGIEILPSAFREGALDDIDQRSGQDENSPGLLSDGSVKNPAQQRYSQD